MTIEDQGKVGPILEACQVVPDDYTRNLKLKENLSCCELGQGEFVTFLQSCFPRYQRKCFGT